MDRIRLLRRIPYGLVLLAAAGAAAWVLLRPPAETDDAHMIQAVDRAGHARGVTADVARAVHRLADLGQTPTPDRYARARAEVEDLGARAGKLADDLGREPPNPWVPVAEATDLLGEAKALAAAALELSPPAAVAPKAAAAADATETDPAKTGLTPENGRVLGARADQLLAGAERLRLRVEQAFTGAAAAQRRFLGFAPADLLLGLLAAAVLVGVLTARSAAAWLSVPPIDAVHAELKRVAATEPRTALTRSHETVRGLLELADSLARGERV